MLARSQEHRRSARRWTRRAVEVILGEREKPIRCVLHNISDSGACIGFANKLGRLPLNFILVLSKDSVQRICQVVWSDDRSVGVKFTSRWFGAGNPEGGSMPRHEKEMSRVAPSPSQHGS